MAIVPLGLAGAALFVILLIRHGVGDVGTAIRTAGWGVAAVVAFEIVPLFFEMLAWRALFPKHHRLARRTLLWMRWVGKSVSTLLPAAQVGGDLVRARLAVTRKVPASVAAASVIADITVSIFAQIIFTLTGVILLVHQTQRSGIVRPAAIGSLIALAAIIGFYSLQRYGMFRMVSVLCAKLAKADAWQSLVKGAEALHCDLSIIYDRHARLLASGMWSLVSWVASATEVWIALWAVGARASFIDALILESVAQGVRSALFLVPAALGVQEGGYLVIGGMLGLSPEIALALALIRRVREMAVGIPGLIVWQVVEGHLWWSGRVRPRRETGSDEVSEGVAESSSTA